VSPLRHGSPYGPGHGRRCDRAERIRSGEIAALADLIAACLAAGSAPVDAVDAAATARGGAAGRQLVAVVAQIRRGVHPATAWRALDDPPDLAALGRALARAAESGTAPAAAVVAVARAQRLAGRLAAEAALARMGVHAALPLGLCFLPAFVCLGVVPVVLDLGAQVLAG
jgi:pilus assembly protein TadC